MTHIRISLWKTTWRLLKQYGLIFAGLAVADLVVNQYFTWLSAELIRSGVEQMLWIGVAVLAQLFYSLISGALWLALVYVGAQALRENRPPPPWKTALESLNQLLIENIRALAVCIRWLPVFILPALYQYVRLAMVPYIALADPEYRKGHVDALTHSQRISQGHFFLVAGALLFSNMVPQILGLMIHGGNDSLRHNPMGALLDLPVTLFFNVFMSLFMISIFERLTKKG